MWEGSAAAIFGHAHHAGIVRPVPHRQGKCALLPLRCAPAWENMIMRLRVSELFNDRSENLRAKVIGIYILLVIANIAAWIWAIVAFYDFPVLLGTAALAYSFGLRHAFDADHIAAIDNVTRKLMQEGKRPVAVGFF